ncbi:unnamed protein product, partial [Polarella glacialis]
VCPLCYIPAGVAGLWGGSGLLLAVDSDGVAGVASSALALGGVPPLAYLGLRRWRNGRMGYAACCFAASSAVLAFFGPKLLSKGTAKLYSSTPPCCQASLMDKQ